MNRGQSNRHSAPAGAPDGPPPGGGWRFHLRWALSSLRIHRTRSLLTGGGMAVAVAIVMSIFGLHRGYERSLDESIAGLGFQVLVTAKGCPYEAASMILRGGQIPMYIDEKIRSRVAAHPDVESISELFIQTLPVDGGRRTQYFTGIEHSYLEMKPWLAFQRGGWFSGPYVDEVILGYNVATYLRLDQGDLLEVEQFGRPLRVAGIFDRTGSQDDGAVFLPLKLAQKLFDRQGKLTGLGIRLKDIRHLDRFVSEVYDLPSVQVVTLAQVQGTLMRLVRSSQMLMMTVAIFALCIAALAVINTVLMSVFERTREFGVLRALGGSRRRLFAVVCLETTALGGLGGVAGVLIALGLSSLAERAVREMLPFAPAGPILRLDVSTAALAVAGACVLGALCSLYPAWRAARTEPVRSLRFTG